MTRLFGICLIAICASSLAACQTSAPASECDGWARIPVTAAGAVKLSSDPDLQPTGKGVAAHNRFGVARKCWL